MSITASREFPVIGSGLSSRGTKANWVTGSTASALELVITGSSGVADAVGVGVAVGVSVGGVVGVAVAVVAGVDVGGVVSVAVGVAVMMAVGGVVGVAVGRVGVALDVAARVDVAVGVERTLDVEVGVAARGVPLPPPPQPARSAPVAANQITIGPTGKLVLAAARFI
ncbi:MAG TPA: hypothetical protein VL049_29125 [Candidatus Dormibacteraeota bacterium]|nr:hypothetical protein [Candidatus Dormibacteraeota bacterium]